MSKALETTHELGHNVSVPLRMLSSEQIAKFTELKMEVGPFAMLTAEEAKVILDVALLAMCGSERAPKLGSLRLYGQNHNHSPELIISAYLAEGYYEAGETNMKLSDFCIDYTMDIIKARLANGTAMKAFIPWYNHDYQFPNDSSIYLPNGSGLRDDHPFLYLCTTYGCFYVHLFTNAPDQATHDIRVMWAIAQALACLRPKDTGLQNALDKVCADIAIYGSREPSELAVMEAVKDLFKSCELPSLQTWQKCRQISMVIHGEDPLYFDPFARGL